MIPRTVHNLGAHECISGMQKFIRRGMEREAMELAVELGHTSKGFATWVTTRLEIISHEDIGLAAPEIIPLVRTCCELSGIGRSEVVRNGPTHVRGLRGELSQYQGAIARYMAEQRENLRPSS